MHASLLHGDFLRRRARRWALIALAAWLPLLLGAAFFKPLWAALVRLTPIPFMLAASGAGLVLLLGLVLGVGAALGAVFLRAEAACSPRTHLHPWRDRASLALALVLSFAPAAAAAFPGAQAMLSASPRLGPGLLWLAAALLLAVAAAGYWRSKWRACRALKAAR